MPITAQLHDGTTLEFPDGTDQAVVDRTVKTHLAKQAPQEVTDFSGNLRLATPFGTLDTGVGLPESVNKGLAQYGSGVADWGLAARQRFGADDEQKPLKQEVADKRSRDAQLNKGALGTILNFGGKLSPALAVPNVGGPVATGALSGLISGAAEPTAEGESAWKNALFGGGIGGAFPAAVKLGGMLFRPSAQSADLANKAADYGINVGLADQAKSGFIKGIRSMLDDAPFIGSIGAKQNETKRAAYEKAVGGTFGAESLKAGDVANASTRVKGELDRLWNNNSLKLDPGLIDDFNRIGTRAADLNPEQQGMVIRQMQKLLQKADNAEIPGSFTNNWQSELRLAVDGEKGLAKDVLNDLRQSAIRAFNRNISPADAEALGLARRQYGNMKTVQPLLAKSEVGVAGRESGDIAGLLPGAVAGRSSQELKDLAAIGSRFLVDRAPKTGGSARAAAQNTLVGLGLTGGGYMGAGPLGAMAAPVVGAGAEWALGSPGLARMARQQAAQRGLLGAPQLTPAMLEAAKRAGVLSLASPGLLTALGLAPLE